MSAGGVRFYSHFDITGYGLSAIAYLRGLLNAGVPVHWVPVRHEKQLSRVDPRSHPMNELTGRDAELVDLSALWAASAQPIECDVVLSHTVPELWPQTFEAGRRNIGYTTWEADAIPPHWKPLLDMADVVCVPSKANRTAFVAEGIRPPVHVVPHIRRHTWNEFDLSELQAMRQGLGIDADDFVFYSINRWDPRKNLVFLLRAYLHAFRHDEPVALVLKTTPMGYGPAPSYVWQPTPEMAQAVIDASSNALGRAPARVCLLPYELSGRGIDLLHALGDCYVSTSHGEGWGLGAFDAATRGTPVVMPRWGGQLDFLGADWPGAINGRLAAVPIWPPNQPSYWPSQRWIEPDFDTTVHALRQAYENPAPGLEAAAGWSAEIANRFAEPVVTDQLLAVIDG